MQQSGQRRLQPAALGVVHLDGRRVFEDDGGKRPPLDCRGSRGGGAAGRLRERRHGANEPGIRSRRRTASSSRSTGRSTSSPSARSRCFTATGCRRPRSAASTTCSTISASRSRRSTRWCRATPAVPPRPWRASWSTRRSASPACSTSPPAWASPVPRKAQAIRRLLRRRRARERRLLHGAAARRPVQRPRRRRPDGRLRRRSLPHPYRRLER